MLGSSTISSNIAIMAFLMLPNVAVYPCPYYALKSFINDSIIMFINDSIIMFINDLRA